MYCISECTKHEVHREKFFITGRSRGLDCQMRWCARWVAAFLLLVSIDGFNLRPTGAVVIARITRTRPAGPVCAAIRELNSREEFEAAMNEARSGVAVVSFSTEKGLPIDVGMVSLSEAYTKYAFFKVVGDRSDDTKALLEDLLVPLGEQTVYLYKDGARRTVKRGGGLDSVALVEAIEDLRWEDGGGDDETKEAKKGGDGRIWG